MVQLALSNGSFSKFTPMALYDPRKVDYSKITGPTTGTLLTTLNPPAGSSHYAINSNNGDIIAKYLPYDSSSADFMTVFLGTGSGWRNKNTLIQDSVLDVPMTISDTYTEPIKLTINRCRIKPSITNQTALGAVTAAVGGIMGSVRNTEIIPVIDAIFAGNNSNYITDIDQCWFHSQYPYALTDGYPWNGSTTFPLTGSTTGLSASTGAFMNDAQQSEAGTMLWQPDVTHTAGSIFKVLTSPSLGYWTIQCVASGQSGTGTAQSGAPTIQNGGSGGVLFYNGKPLRLKDTPAGTEPSFVLQGGTARYIVIGIALHSDGIQFIGGGNVAVTRSKLEGANNSEALVQSFGGTSEPPCKNVTFDQNYFLSPDESTYTIYVNSNQGIAAYGGSVMTGGYTWATGNVWTPTSSLSGSRPWFVTFTNNYFGRASNPNPSYSKVISSGSVLGDVAIFVPDEATRDAGIAAQFGVSVATAQAMKLPNYNWTSGTPAVDQSILTNRLQTFQNVIAINGTDSGGHQGKCDARTWIVWSNNRTAGDSSLIHPGAQWAGKSGFDINGYYTGV